MRKQVYELVEADLAREPVWEFALDEEGEEGQDEATVRPVAAADVAGQCIVRATFELADGTVFFGYVSPTPAGDDLGSLQPVILTSAGQVSFWRGMLEPSKEDLNLAYSRLGKSMSAVVFPVRFKADVAEFAETQGTIPGFVVLTDFETNEIQVIT
jgi:hypothetical protein